MLFLKILLIPDSSTDGFSLSITQDMIPDIQVF